MQCPCHDATDEGETNEMRIKLGGTVICNGCGCGRCRACKIVSVNNREMRNGGESKGEIDRYGQWGLRGSAEVCGMNGFVSGIKWWLRRAHQVLG